MFSNIYILFAISLLKPKSKAFKLNNSITLGIFLGCKVYFDLIKFALTISFLSILSWKFIKDRVIYPNYFYKIVLM